MTGTTVLWNAGPGGSVTFEARLSIVNDDPEDDVVAWEVEVISDNVPVADRVRFVEAPREVEVWDLIGLVAKCYEEENE